MNQSDAKNWARQIVKSSMHEILAGEYQVPSHMEMEAYISANFDEPFDEHKVRIQIRKLHPAWSEIEISDEVERRERVHERENRNMLKWFTQSTIGEIEKLIKSLNQEIAKWKVKNL